MEHVGTSRCPHCVPLCGNCGTGTTGTGTGTGGTGTGVPLVTVPVPVLVPVPAPLIPAPRHRYRSRYRHRYRYGSRYSPQYDTPRCERATTHLRAISISIATSVAHAIAQWGDATADQLLSTARPHADAY